jgi:hypothetical protein
MIVLEVFYIDNLIPNTTKNMIKDRMKHLEELGAKAVNKIKD